MASSPPHTPRPRAKTKKQMKTNNKSQVKIRKRKQRTISETVVKSDTHMDGCWQKSGTAMRHARPVENSIKRQKETWVAKIQEVQEEEWRCSGASAFRIRESTQTKIRPKTEDHQTLTSPDVKSQTEQRSQRLTGKAWREQYNRIDKFSQHPKLCKHGCAFWKPSHTMPPRCRSAVRARGRESLHSRSCKHIRTPRVWNQQNRELCCDADVQSDTVLL